VPAQLPYNDRKEKILGTWQKKIGRQEWVLRIKVNLLILCASKYYCISRYQLIAIQQIQLYEASNYTSNGENTVMTLYRTSVCGIENYVSACWRKLPREKRLAALALYLWMSSYHAWKDFDWKIFLSSSFSLLIFSFLGLLWVNTRRPTYFKREIIYDDDGVSLYVGTLPFCSYYYFSQRRQV